MMWVGGEEGGKGRNQRLVKKMSRQPLEGAGRVIICLILATTRRLRVSSSVTV